MSGQASSPGPICFPPYIARAPTFNVWGQSGMRAVMRWTAVAVLIVAGCGDGETRDSRGYTKAPLETPGVLIDAERRSEMARLGTPNVPTGEAIAAPADSASS